MAAAHAAADYYGMPLYLYLGGFNAKELPTNDEYLKRWFTR